MPRKPKRKGSLKGEGSHWELPDGTWRGYVTLPGTGGKRKWVSGQTEREVIAAKRKKLQEHEAGLDLSADRITLTTYLAKWLTAAVEPSKSPVTLRSYEVQCRLHIAPALGHVRMQELTSQQVQLWIQGRTKEGHAARQVRYAHTILHGALKQAVRWGMLVRNPSENVVLPKVPRVEIRYWTPDEVRTFLQHVKGDRLEALYALGLGLGLRRSELLGLTWSAVDLEKGTLSVRQTLQRLQGGVRMLEPKTKASRRTLVLPAFILGLLKARRVAYLEEQMRKRKTWQGDSWDTVFATTKGTPVEAIDLARAFDKAAEGAGLGRITLHGMRHSAATAMLSRGISPRIVADILGHSNVATTLNLYAHVMPSDHQQVAQIVHALYA